MLVVGAVEVANGAPGLTEITDFSAPSLHGFIAANVASGTTIRTDGWSGYPGAPDVAHDPHVIGPIAAHVVLPWIHRVFSNLKTWALVYHGLRKKHLQAYLDEFVSVSIAVAPATPLSAPSSASASPSTPHADRTGSNGISLICYSQPPGCRAYSLSRRCSSR